MKLIADSGSTKTDWRTLNENGEIGQFKTQGIQPNYMSLDEIAQVIKVGLQDLASDDISEIYFYGSGCSSETNQKVIRNAIQPFFKKANIDVNHDLLAAARALCGREKGIACILGTGSNSGLYDGECFVENVRSLGYLLGDEGSGTYIGKKLLVALLRDELPVLTKTNFQSRFKMTERQVIENLYKAQKPQQFLSQFSKFVFQNIKEPFLYKLVYDAFVDFIEVNVKPYSNYENVPVHFTGSVAFYFGNILRKVGQDQGILVKHIVEGPIAGLTLYHKEEI